MSAQTSMLVDEPDHERDREFEVDRTPRGLVRAALGAHLAARGGEHSRTVAVAGHHVWHPSDGPLRVLDVCAGSGVWASEMRAWCERHGIPVEITAIEVRPEEREHLERVADFAVIGDALDLLGDDHYYGAHRWHIAIGNPAFSLLAWDPQDTARIPLAPTLLELALSMILLSTTQAFTRSKRAAEWLHGNPPALETRIAQTVSFRGGSKSDGISYSVTSWVPYMRHPLPGTPWPCSVLVLPGEARRWRVPPGQEGAP